MRGIATMNFPKVSIPNVGSVFVKEARYFVIGNGGSCKNAEHFASDLREIGFDADALADSGNLTAIGNDFGYDQVFVKQLETKVLDRWVLICLSGSGNSKNILAAVGWAKVHGGKVVTITSAQQGALRELGDYNILIESADMEDIESTTLHVMHEIKRKLRDRRMWKA